MNNSLDLDLALAIWECGDPIPVDLAMRLAEQGLDVEALESQHRTY